MNELNQLEGGQAAIARAAFLLLTVCLIGTACGGREPTAPTPSNGFAGRWSGTVVVGPLLAPGTGVSTFQNQPLSFTVSGDQRVTDLSIGYSFRACSGVKTLTGISIGIIGASPFGKPGEQGWGYASPPLGSDGSDRFEVYGAFTSERAAYGTALFVEFPGCGSGIGIWTATKQ